MPTPDVQAVAGSASAREVVDLCSRGLSFIYLICFPNLSHRGTPGATWTVSLEVYLGRESTAFGVQTAVPDLLPHWAPSWGALPELNLSPPC